MGMTEKFVQVRNLKTRYIQSGTSKPSIVMLHGWGGTADNWRDNIAGLSHKYTCYAIDLPIHGKGGSQSPDTAWNVSDYIAYLEEFLENAGVTDRPFLVGKSFGGRVAIKYTIRNQGKLAGLFLVDAAGTERRNVQTKMLVKIAHVSKRIFQLLPFLPEDKVRQIFYKKIGLDAKENALRRQTRQNAVAENLTPLLSQIHLPTLVVWGEGDKILPLALGKQMAAMIPNSRLAVIERGSHNAHEEQPEKFNAIIEDFIENIMSNR
jgi:pimeloyl-ACP methyl ester carboxylesterase